MTKKRSDGSKPSGKPVFPRLKPSMSREEKMQNLLAALKASGIDVKPSKKPSRENGKSRDLIQKLMEEEGLTEEQAVRLISDTHF